MSPTTNLLITNKQTNSLTTKQHTTMIWLILIICAFAVDSMGDNKKKRYNKRRSSYNSWYNENSWLDAAWFHDHHQKM